MEPVSGEFTKFNFSTGQITTSDTDWDVAFRATTIIVNGGVSLETIDEPTRTGNSAVYIANGTMSSVTDVDLMSLTQDSSNVDMSVPYWRWKWMVYLSRTSCKFNFSDAWKNFSFQDK